MAAPPFFDSTTMLCALLLPFLQVPQLAPHIEARGSEGFEFVGEVVGDSQAFLLPTVSTNERAARLVVGPRGARIRLASPAGVTTTLESVRLLAIEHPQDQHLMLEGDALTALSSPRLPNYVRRSEDARSRLPELARCDLESIAAEALTIAPGPGEGWVLVLVGEERVGGSLTLDGVVHELGDTPLSALLLPAEGPQLLELSPGAQLDQAYFARPRPLRPEAIAACQLERAWSYPETTPSWTRRGGRGPEQPLAAPRGGHADELEVTAAPFVIDPGELLELRFAAPSAPLDQAVHTYRLELISRREPSPEPIEATAPASAARPFFVDRFREAGLDAVHFEGPHDQRDIRPTMGPGAAWGDVDGDGWQDLLLVQGGGREGCQVPRSRLYRNVEGRFVQHDLLAPGAGMGALFFDLEGDGDLDLYVANYGPDRLYTNDGSGAFEDVSTEQGIGGELWSAGVCAGDTDGDGDLEVYVTSYLDYDLEKLPPIEELPGFRREDPVEMLPFAFPGERNTFYENRAGRLVDVTDAKGLADTQGRGMQAVFWDFDRDGDLDLYVANDVSFNVLLRNDGEGNFEDISFQTGMDDPRGGMGVALGDVDGDRDEDLFLTNWQLEANALYLNHHVASSTRKAHLGTFQDGTVRSRLGPAGVGVTSWGAVLFDADNDGDLDLFIPNGYTSPDYESTGICVGQPNQFFLNDGEGRFVDASAAAGPDVTCSLASRSAAVCDYDQDGRLDLLVTTNNGPYQLLHNELEESGHWLGVRLRARGANPFAVGARVELEAGELSLTRTLTAGEGYLACHASELHFGLGPNEAVESLEVHWPSGRTTSHEVAIVDRWILIEEPE